MEWKPQKKTLSNNDYFPIVDIVADLPLAFIVLKPLLQVVTLSSF